MQLALRRAYGYAYGPPRPLSLRGLGQSGEVGSEGGSLPDFGTVTGGDPIPTDPSTFLPPGYNITGVTPGAELTPAQLAQQQAEASAWLLQNIPTTPPGMTTAQTLSTLALTASQIATGLTAGTVQRAATCPSGYQYASGPCVPGAATGQLISGVSNSTLGIAAIAFLALMMFSGGRRR